MNSSTTSHLVGRCIVIRLASVYCWFRALESRPLKFIKLAPRIDDSFIHEHHPGQMVPSWSRLSGSGSLTIQIMPVEFNFASKSEERESQSPWWYFKILRKEANSIVVLVGIVCFRPSQTAAATYCSEYDASDRTDTQSESNHDSILGPGVQRYKAQHMASMHTKHERSSKSDFAWAWGWDPSLFHHQTPSTIASILYTQSFGLFKIIPLNQFFLVASGDPSHDVQSFQAQYQKLSARLFQVRLGAENIPSLIQKLQDIAMVSSISHFLP